MRIAYVAMRLRGKDMVGGAGQKVKTQLRFWQENGHTARLFALVPDYQGPDIYTYRARSGLPGIEELTRIISRTRVLSRLMSDVRKYHPDVIYLRCGVYTFPIHRLFSIAPTIMELNANDIEERRLQGRFSYWFNLLTRGILLSRVAGLVPVTYEIAQMPENLRYRKPSHVIANGADLGRIEPLSAPHNKTPVLTMVGHTGMSWHGVDKLLVLARLYPDLTINIVGYSHGDIADDVPPNVHLWGFLSPDELQPVLAGSDVAFGTLAFHRKNMQEASPLKVREALGFGIPVILGYQDTDIGDLAIDTVLCLPNEEDNVVQNLELIRDFAYRMMGRRVDRDAIASRIDQSHKEEERLLFFEEMV